MLDTQILPKINMRLQTDEQLSVGAEPVQTTDRKIDVRQLIAPVNPGLLAVEEKMQVVDSSLFAPLATAFVELIGSGGKRIRPALVLLTAKLIDASVAQHYSSANVALAASVEMLHTATLVHDDVIDESLLRRGAPTLNASWSKGSTVLAGNFMFGRAAKFVSETNNVRVIDIFSDTLQVIVNGELRQLFARFDYNQERDEYLERIYAKTASLFCAATEGAAVLAGLPEPQTEQLRLFGYNLGMAFQIVDDILDFTSDHSTLGKPAGSDLSQGTLTLPFFYYLQAQSQPHQFLAHLEKSHSRAGMNGTDLWQKTVAETVQEMRASDAIRFAQQDAFEYADLARTNLEQFADSVFKRSMLGLCDFVVDRTF